MSVIEKLDELIETFRTFAPPAHKAAATADFLRDHGPAIRKAMIDAERYRWIRDNTWDNELWEVIANHKNKLWDAAIDKARATGEGEGNG